MALSPKQVRAQATYAGRYRLTHFEANIDYSLVGARGRTRKQALNIYLTPDVTRRDIVVLINRYERKGWRVRLHQDASARYMRFTLARLPYRVRAKDPKRFETTYHGAC